MKRGLGLSNEELTRVYDRWNGSALRGYLIGITARILERKDEGGGQSLVDMILDEAKQKGTGMWTAQDAMELRVPVPTIGSAVAMRDLSDLREERLEAAQVLTGPERDLHEEKEGFVGRLGRAEGVSMAILYAQGMAQLRQASDTYGYGLNLEEVARIWRGGCIIRSDIARAHQAGLPQPA